jgi:hypothetical protein
MYLAAYLLHGAMDAVTRFGCTFAPPEGIQGVRTVRNNRFAHLGALRCEGMKGISQPPDMKFLDQRVGGGIIFASTSGDYR